MSGRGIPKSTQKTHVYVVKDILFKKGTGRLKLREHLEQGRVKEEEHWKKKQLPLQTNQKKEKKASTTRIKGKTKGGGVTMRLKSRILSTRGRMEGMFRA